MSTQVRVVTKGVHAGLVLHKHPTVANTQGRWHGPWERHPEGDSAHAKNAAEKPFGGEKLSAEMAKQMTLHLTSHQRNAVADVSYVRARQLADARAKKAKDAAAAAKVKPAKRAKTTPVAFSPEQVAARYEVAPAPTHTKELTKV